MKYAIVELKYVKKKFFIVPIGWIKNYTNKTKLSSNGLMCFISTDLSEDPDFSAKYLKIFEGASGMFKVFVTKITNTLEAAITYLKNSRLQSVPDKLRQPSNTDSELIAEEKKRKRTENRIQKSNIETANVKNTSHLAQLVKSHCDTTERETDKENATINTTLDVPSSSSTVNKKQNQSIVVFPNKKGKNPTLVGETTQTSSTATAKQIIPSPPTSANKKQNQSIVVIPTENKGENSTLVGETIEKFQTQTTSTATAKQIIPSSSTSANKKQNQSIVVIPTENRGENSTFVRQVVGDGVSSGSTSNKILTFSGVYKINQDQSQVHSKQAKPNSLPVTKPIQNKVVDLCTANVSAASVPFKVPQGVAPKPLIGNGKRLAEIIIDKNVKFSSKKRKVVHASEIPITKTSETPPTKVSEMAETIKKLKEETAQLKMANRSLSERNTALQIALVTCTKAIPPPLSFKKKDGGRLYKCGIFLNESQCKVLDATTDDQQYCNALTLAIFGSETLKVSSVKGMKSNRTGAPARPPLNSIGLKFIYDTMAIRTNNSERYCPYKVNRIINRKISNLRASEQEPKPRVKKAQKTKVDESLGDHAQNDGSEKEAQEETDEEEEEKTDNEEEEKTDNEKEEKTDNEEEEKTDNEEDDNEEDEDADNEEYDNEESEAEDSDAEIIENDYNEQEGSKGIDNNSQQNNEQGNRLADTVNENGILELDCANLNLDLSEYISPDNTFYIMDVPEELCDYY